MLVQVSSQFPCLCNIRIKTTHFIFRKVLSFVYKHLLLAKQRNGKKGKSLYIAVSSLQDCSKHFTSLADLFNQTPF